MISMLILSRLTAEAKLKMRFNQRFLRFCGLMMYEYSAKTKAYIYFHTNDTAFSMYYTIFMSFM